MSAMFYAAMLEYIIGEPQFCETDLNCPKCLRKINRHHAESWHEHLTDELNTLEAGWGNAYVDLIVSSRTRRNLFAHGAAYSDLMQERWKIYDKRTYYGKDITEEGMKKEKEIANEENNLNILERTVRKLLQHVFLIGVVFDIRFTFGRSRLLCRVLSSVLHSLMRKTMAHLVASVHKRPEGATEVIIAYFVTWFIQHRYPLVCHTISSTSVILSF